MTKVYSIETVGRADFCIGCFVDFEKAKGYFEKAKTLVGKEETPTIELKLASGLQLVEWEEDKWRIVEEWTRD